MNSIIACNIRLVVRSVKITQITAGINIVLACCRSNLLLLSPRREGEAGRHTFLCSIACRSFCGRNTAEKTYNNIP